MSNQDNTATRMTGRVRSHGRMKALVLHAVIAGLVATVIVLTGTESAHACLLPGIPC